MTNFDKKQGWFVCLLLATAVSVGCETNNYEPLIIKKKMKELEGEIEALKSEISELKNGNFVPGAVQENGETTTAETADSATSRVIYSADDELKIREALENSDAYFSVDDSGFAVEADLTECRKGNEAVEQLVGFAKLTKVILDGTTIDSDTFDSLSKMDELAHLEIERSSPDAQSLEKLKRLKNLKFLQLFKATLSEDAVKVLSEFPALEQIRCGQTRVGDDELRHLANLKTLKAIDLSDCNRVTIDGLKSLSQCPNLSFLKVWGDKIDNEGMKHVAKMKSLKVLGLNDTSVDDEGIGLLADLGLQEIHLFRTLAGDESLRVISQMPNMKTLNVRDTRLTDKGIEYLANLKDLEKLDLSECNSPGITDACGQHLAKMANLKQLNLWSTKFTDEGLKHLTGLKNLTWLNLDNTGITDDGVAMLAEMPQLTWLHLGKTNITDREVKTLMGLENLKYLSISHTKISEDAYYDIDDHFSPKGCEVIAP
jgi:internalin A